MVRPLSITSTARAYASSKEAAWAWLEERLGTRSSTGGEIAALFTKPVQSGPLKQGSMVRTTGSRGTEGLARIQQWDPAGGVCELWFLGADGQPWRLHHYQIIGGDDPGSSCTVQLRVEISYQFDLGGVLLVLLHLLQFRTKHILAKSCLQHLR